jgi:DNA repair ATPase RecN
MKLIRYAFLAAMLLATNLLLPPPARAQGAEARQLLLNVEKLRQLRSILSDMKQGYTILRKGYGTIRDISQGSFSLHATFLDNLLAVNPAVRRYSRVADILTSQQHLLREHREALRRIRESGAFTPGELEYLTRVYGNLSARSLRHLEELTLVLTAGTLRMSDAERLTFIDGIYREVSADLVFLRQFTRQATILALQRKKEQRQVRTLRHLFRVPGL